MSRIFSVAKKELWSYFASPTALIFLGTYLFVSLFTFFWVEKFFSRNIADLRPLFEWMPLLLIFLVSTLTMRMWADERRMGTLEFLMTLPVKTLDLVLGKLFAVMALVCIALALTVGLAFTVSALGDLDWGPVFGAYVASILLAGAYASIGLFVSSRTDSQIVSLISTVLLCSIFYLLGSETLLSLFGNQSGSVLRLLGTGSRFESISRGVFDLRDIYYYASIIVAFSTLNVLSLDRLKWSTEGHKKSHTLVHTFVALVLLNVVGANFWIQRLTSVRLDMTQNKLFSISDTTRDVLDRLQEPLRIRGVFSEKTHPLLAPLVPALRDLLVEYQVAGKGRVLVEIIDPSAHPETEAELNRKFGLKTVPFQVQDKNSATMLNSYFNVVLEYGNKNEVLGFENLIAVKQTGISNIDVKLRNPEYDITRSIAKVIKEFNSNDNLFAELKTPVQFTGYVSSALPKQLFQYEKEVREALDEYKKQSNGKLLIEFKDPEKDPALAREIEARYGFRPQSLSLFSEKTFYFYLTLQDGEKTYSLGIPEQLSLSGFKSSMNAALKRIAPGFVRTIGVVTPPDMSNPMMAQFGGAQPSKTFRALKQKLEENYSTELTDLSSGKVGNNIDVLMLLAPKELDEKAVFAVDQFLMAGGTVIASTSPFAVLKERTGIQSEKYKSGLEDWLAHHGLSIPEELVLDEQNSGFPTFRVRNVRGVTIREPQIRPYPFFIDVRGRGLNSSNLITAGVNQLSMTWASPLVIDPEKNKDRTTTTLIKSSPKAWTTSDSSIEANPDLHPELGFPLGDKREAVNLAGLVEGKFTSFFAGRKSPLIESAPKDEADKKDAKGAKTPTEEKEKDVGVVTGVINHSPNSARLVVYASNEFLADDTLQIESMLQGSQALTALQLVENTVDWATEERALLGIRAQGHFARTLVPLSDQEKQYWEFMNYLIAALGLLAVYGASRYLKRQSVVRFESIKATA